MEYFLSVSREICLPSWYKPLPPPRNPLHPLEIRRFMGYFSCLLWCKWQPTPVFLPGESHGQKSLVGYGAWGHKESDSTEWLNTHTLWCISPWSTIYITNYLSELKRGRREFKLISQSFILSSKWLCFQYNVRLLICIHTICAGKPQEPVSGSLRHPCKRWCLNWKVSRIYPVENKRGAGAKRRRSKGENEKYFRKRKWPL